MCAGQAEVGDQGQGESELEVGGDDQPGPAFGLWRAFRSPETGPCRVLLEIGGLSCRKIFQNIATSFKDGAVKMLIESSRPVADVAREFPVNEGTLGNWVNRYRKEHVGEEPPLEISGRARLKELEDEVRELRLKNEFLGKRRPSSPRSIGELAV